MHRFVGKIQILFLALFLLHNCVYFCADLHFPRVDLRKCSWLPSSLAFNLRVFSVLSGAPDIFFCQCYTPHSVGDAYSLEFAFWFGLPSFLSSLLCVSVPCGPTAPTLALPRTWKNAWPPESGHPNVRMLMLDHLVISNFTAFILVAETKQPTLFSSQN